MRYALFLVAFVLLISSTLIQGCGDDDRRRRGNDDRRQDLFDDEEDRNEDDDREDLENDPSSLDGDPAPYSTDLQPAAQQPLSGGPSLVEPIKQQGLSNTLDFIFVINASKNNPYIDVSHIKETLGSLPLRLNQENMDWRFYFLNAEMKTNRSGAAQGRNGKLLNLEYNGSIIHSQYLDNEVANFYAGQVSDIFVSTVGRANRDCDFPPYCHDDKTHAPLRVLKEFFLKSHNILRENSGVVVVNITNIDESPTYQSKGKKPKEVEAPEVVSRFKEIYTEKQIYFINIVVTPINENCLSSNKKNKYGSRVSQTSILTKGLILDICADHSHTEEIVKFIKTMQGNQYNSPNNLQNLPLDPFSSNDPNS